MILCERKLLNTAVVYLSTFFVVYISYFFGYGEMEFERWSGLPADGNCDGVIDQADYSVWADNYGHSIDD